MGPSRAFQALSVPLRASPVGARRLSQHMTAAELAGRAESMRLRVADVTVELNLLIDDAHDAVRDCELPGDKAALLAMANDLATCWSSSVAAYTRLRDLLWRLEGDDDAEDSAPFPGA